MNPQPYAAARAVSAPLYSYFLCHRDEARKRGAKQLAELPDELTIETLIDAGFWASLRREEGYSPRISLAFLSPEQAEDPLLFERPFPLDPGLLTRVAPAVERPGIHLGVWRNGKEFFVWGATRSIPLLCFVLEVTAPGLLVVKHHKGEETRKFINVAVLEGDRVKMVDERAPQRPDAPRMLRSLLQFDSAAASAQSTITLVQLAVSIREHGRGGLLLIVPADSNAWRESMVEPVAYAISPPFRALGDVHRRAAEPGGREPSRAASKPAVALIGGLTAVDGAVVIDSRYELLGFGAKIVRKQGSGRVEDAILTEPIQGSTPALVHVDQLGGTRHLAAAQFSHDQRDAVALAASQDGRFTIFEWSEADGKVRAHRVESLLL